MSGERYRLIWASSFMNETRVVKSMEFNNLWLLNVLTKEKGNVNYFSIGQYWKNHGFTPLFDQSEKVLQRTFGASKDVIGHWMKKTNQVTNDGIGHSMQIFNHAKRHDRGWMS